MIADPLTVLPPELVLRILEFAPIGTLAGLTRASKAWHAFIDTTHQEAIYSIDNKISIPAGCESISDATATATSFSRYYEGTHSSKDLCKRQTQLSRSWDSAQPRTTESIIQIGHGPVWRFRADFKRRFFLSTSQAGGLTVTCMDTGRRLWGLPSSEQSTGLAAPPYAHLEYDNGMAVFNQDGNALEVWQTEVEGLPRGEFKQTAILPFDVQTRGFQLSHDTLCVVSTEGLGFVYDMTQQPPQLTQRLDIERDAVGHLYQDAEVVMYSMGEEAFHFYNKATAEFLGALKPTAAAARYHIRHPPSAYQRTPRRGRHGPSARAFPPSMPRDDRLVPLEVFFGALPSPDISPLVGDEWGAGALYGNLMVGLSRRGHVFICSDWRQALQGNNECTAVIETEYGASNFDLGGWLSVKDHRVMVEVQERIYVIGLDDDDRVQASSQDTATTTKLHRPSYALTTSSAPGLAAPVSFMALFDDCIMSTYTTLGVRPPAAVDEDQPHNGLSRIFPTKMIRVLSLAPESNSQPPALWRPQTSESVGQDQQRSRADLLEMMDMVVGGDVDLNMADDEDLIEMVADFRGVEWLLY